MQSSNGATAAAADGPEAGAGPASVQPGGGWDGGVTLERLRRDLSHFAAERDWGQYHTPRNLLLALVGEVGELSELFQWRGEVRCGIPDFSPKDRQAVKEELADVLLYLVRLADACDVDLGQAALEKMGKNAAKYPVEQCRGSSAKYTELRQAARAAAAAEAAGAAKAAGAAEAAGAAAEAAGAGPARAGVE